MTLPSSTSSSEHTPLESVNELINFASIPIDSISDLIPNDEDHRNYNSRITSSGVTIIYCIYCNKYYPPKSFDLADCYSEIDGGHIQRKRIMVCKNCMKYYQTIRYYTRPRLVVADKKANDEQAIFDTVVSFIDQGFITVVDNMENDKVIRIDLSDINIHIDNKDKHEVAKSVDSILFEILRGLYDYDGRVRSVLKDDKYSISSKNKALFKMRYELRQHYLSMKTEFYKKIK
jgi:hypothetical protein